MVTSFHAAGNDALAVPVLNSSPYMGGAEVSRPGSVCRATAGLIRREVRTSCNVEPTGAALLPDARHFFDWLGGNSADVGVSFYSTSFDGQAEAVRNWMLARLGD